MSILIGVSIAVVIITTLISMAVLEDWDEWPRGVIIGAGIALSILSIGIPMTYHKKEPQKIITQTIIKHDTIYVNKPDIDIKF